MFTEEHDEGLFSFSAIMTDGSNYHFKINDFEYIRNYITTNTLKLKEVIVSSENVMEANLPISLFKLFGGCKSLISVDLNGLNTIKVKDMSFMFFGCDKLKYIKMNEIKTDSLTTISNMFCRCGSLEELDMTSFKIDSNVDTNFMFDRCTKLTEATAANLDVCKVLNFSNGKPYNVWFKVNGMYNVLCTNLQGLTYNRIFDTYNETVAYIHDGRFKSAWTSMRIDNSTVDSDLYPTSLRSMFESCLQLVSIDVSGLITDKVTDMAFMFNGCTNLKYLTLGGMNTSNVTFMNRMFCGCNHLSSLKLCSFDTSKVSTMEYMFSGCSRITSLDLSTFTLTENLNTNLSYMFYGATALLECLAKSEKECAKFNDRNITYLSNRVNFKVK